MRTLLLGGIVRFLAFAGDRIGVLMPSPMSGSLGLSLVVIPLLALALCRGFSFLLDRVIMLVEREGCTGA